MENVPLTVAEIYREHGFSASLIDTQAGVPAGTTNRMMQNLPVSRDNAMRVLTAISAKTRQNYILGNLETLPPIFAELREKHHLLRVAVQLIDEEVKGWETGSHKGRPV